MVKMKKNLRKTAGILAVVMMMGVVSSCKKEEQKQENVAVNAEPTINFNQYKNSEEIPDWTGNKLKLTVWSTANGTNASDTGKVSEMDLVGKEYERVTGVSFDKDLSFDNAGGSFDARVAKIIASNEYPDAAFSIPDLTGLIQKGVLWRLDELVEEYAPTVYKLFGPDSHVYGAEWKRQMEEYGGVYSVSLSATEKGLRNMVNLDKSYDLTQEQIDLVSGVGSSPYGYFYMREDVLKKIYPEAHSREELMEIYEKNGKFTEEEIFDVPIESPEQFIEMLYKVKDIIKESGEINTYAFYTHSGSDNWPLLTQFASVMGYNANYFSYWDKEDKTIKYTFKEDWFKEVLRTYSKLIQDGVASQEALIDTSTQFKEKLNTGKYIISLPVNNPKSTDEHKYRKVYVRYPYNQDKFPEFGNAEATLVRWSFFNKNLDENDIIQCVKMLEFSASDPGQKLTYWGPASAGLYEEDENGNLQFINEDLKTDYLSGGKDNIRKYLYGWPGIPGVSATKYHPKMYYPDNKKWSGAFNAALYHKSNVLLGLAPNIYENAVIGVIEGANSFWSARNGFESLLLKVFASANDNEFENNYKEMLVYAEKYGLTDEVLEEFNTFYKEDYNKEYMYQFEQ